GGLGGPLGPGAHDPFGIVDVPDHHSRMDGRQGVEREFEGGDDAEAPASSAQGPEQALVLGAVGADELAIGQNDLGGGIFLYARRLGMATSSLTAVEKVAAHSDIG